ncbi:MAG: pentapeptide repeat-containing protein [Chromatiales bacterium]|nr:pentapeptide repeat-containing protein [Chromatiales bacterium]
MNDGITQTGKQVLWYIRRSNSIKGPFPSGTLRRFLVVGRVKLTDEVSRDKENWATVAETPEVIPPDVRKAIEEGDVDALLTARMREDERSGHDRRQSSNGDDNAKFQHRRKGDRRQGEDDILQQYRTNKSELRREIEERRVPTTAIGVLVAIVAVAVGYGMFLGKPNAADDPDCQAVAAAGVNWRNCRLDQLVAESAMLQGALLNNAILRRARLSGTQLMGADIQYADLSGADLSYTDLTGSLLKGATLRHIDLTNANLTNVDLSFSDLTGASIGGAVFTNTRLDNAIWLNGSVCRPGSVGHCIPK